eukprot:jgi/Mesen1/3238/ME000187S02408
MADVSGPAERVKTDPREACKKAQEYIKEDIGFENGERIIGSTRGDKEAEKPFLEEGSEEQGGDQGQMKKEKTTQSANQ